MQRYSQTWSIQTGARIRVVRYDLKDVSEAGPRADLWIIPPAQLPHWAVAGKLREVPESITAEGAPFAWEKLLRIYQKLLTWDRKVYGLPLLGDALLCFYREDVLQDPRIRAEFTKGRQQELPPPGSGPRSWDEFVAIAEHFNKQKRPGIDHACASLPPLPALDDELDREFYAAVIPFARVAAREDDRKPPPDNEVFSFHYDLASGDMRIQTPAFREGLNLLKRLQACRPEKDSADPAAGFLNGEAVLYLGSSACVGRFQSAPQLRGKFGFCRPPGSRLVFDYQTGTGQVVPHENFVPYLGAGGWIAVVPRSNEAPDAAFALAALLGSPEVSREIVIEPEWGGGVFRREHLEGQAGWQSFGLGDKTEPLLQTLREVAIHPQVKNPAMRLRIPDERTHQTALLREVRAALLDGKDSAQALQDAARRWREIDGKKDLKTRRSEYRLNLGLRGDL